MVVNQGYGCQKIKVAIVTSISQQSYLLQFLD